jgi:Xaa-Pro aminopeptidase
MTFEERRQRVVKRLGEAGLDALLVSRLTNIRYLTGFRGSAAYLLLSAQPTLWIDFRYAENARRQVPDLEHRVASSPPRLWPELLQHLGKENICLGFEAGHLTAGQYFELAEAAREKLEPTKGLIEALRAIKDRDEIALLRRAIKVADDVMPLAWAKLEAGLSEMRIAGEIELAQRERAVERSSAELIVASGERTALPHGVASPRLLRDGEPVMIDLSPVVDGYRADLTRTVHLGAASNDFREIYELVLKAQETALSGIRAGITGREADFLARHVIEDAGYGDRFQHSLGHSIGLDTHEPPLLSPHDLTVLETGMVVSVEPGVYFPERFGVRIEDVVLVQDRGCEILSRCPKGLLEL